MNIILWVVQVLLALVFVIAAGLKLFAFDMLAARSPGTDGLHGLFVVIGLCEIAGAIGLIAPRVTRIMPVLTPLAAAGLATIALLACGFDLGRGEFGETLPAAVLALLCACAVWGRGIATARGTRPVS